MSWSEHCVQDHRRKTDCAIHQAYAQLALDPASSEKFDQILRCVRRRAPRLLEAPFVDGHHCGIDALVNLSRFRGAHIRPVVDWTGTTSSWRPAVSLLAHHLTCAYKVPMFLASSWYARDRAADTKRGWFVEHSRGASFRSLNLPIVMTRNMEHFFLDSPDHLPIEHALRKAELLALGARPDLVKAVLSTRLGADLRHGESWRTFWMFLIRNAGNFDPAQVGPMIDFIQTVRHERVTVETPDGKLELDPLQPAFSMKGRTVQSVLRLVEVWHRSLGTGGASLSWLRSPFDPLLVEEPGRDRLETPRRWHMFELTNSAQLRIEGSVLRHCVAIYAERCCRGLSSIWSLRVWQGERIRHVLTVEVDPRSRTVVQARGRANRQASGKSLELLNDWAVRERLRMAV